MGTQYRSVIFFHDAEQKAVAEDTIERVEKSGIWGKPIVTQIVPFETFYRAENYHQNYFKTNPNQPYCSVVIAPKVAKFRKHYMEKLRK